MSTQIVAHRGESGLAPENTLAAIREAARQRADFVEVDVQLTADGEVVLYHDVELDRTTDAAKVFPGRAPWRVNEFTLDELKRLDAGRWFAQAYTGERIPTLAEALDVMAGRIGLWLELKSPHLHPGLEKAVAGVLADADERWLGEAGWCVATSFEAASVERFAAEVGRAVPLGQLAKGVPGDDELRQEAKRVDYYLPDHRAVTPEDVTRVRAAGLRAGFWTPNSPADLSALITAGASAVITNYTQLARPIAQGAYRAPADGPVLQRLSDGSVVVRNMSPDPVSLAGWRLRGDPAAVLATDLGAGLPGSLAGSLPGHLPGRGILEEVLDGQDDTDSVALHRPDDALVDVVARLRAPQSW